MVKEYIRYVINLSINFPPGICQYTLHKQLIESHINPVLIFIFVI